MAITRHVINITTAADGSATVYSDVPLRGKIDAIRYVPDGTSPMANTADLTITGENSGIAVLTITNQAQSAQTYMPRGATHDTSGAASLYAAAGTAVTDKIPVAGERLKVVVAQGGNALSGALHIYVES